ncbi:MAG: glucose-6-phosphate isomerase [Burkholderiales bacterium]|nr:glucose-6-phosphate isomerase [Burkholderiales bacterium]
MPQLTRSPAWQALAAHRGALASATIRDLFAHDVDRARRFCVEAAGLCFDYSKHRLTDETLRLLVALAEQADVGGWTRRMFAGEAINSSEGRAVLHVALRAGAGPFPAGGDVMPEVSGTLARMRAFADAVRSGDWRGATGELISDVVNIGIGGSDLGPRMVTRALRAYCAPRPRLHFVSNADPADLAAVLAALDPAHTLFIVTSKTFTTAETLSNAERARAWNRDALGERAAARHFVAVSANVPAATAFGISADAVFPMWDWVGGRYSLWSAVGLPIVLAVGFERFAEFLAGARAMDEHFREAPAHRNIPILMGLLGVWYTNFWGAQSHCVLPYAEDLRDLPAYLQQLEMESNGKRIDRDGNPVDYATAPVIWGAAGTNSQHSFHQLLHQGTLLVPSDFVLFRRGAEPAAAHAMLTANGLAQSAALMAGKDDPAAPHRALPGNQPSSTFLLPALDPRALGALIAAYEHKVFAQGVVWNINSFDQWGVEHGKVLARNLLPRILQGGEAHELDASTRALLARLRAG